MRRGLLGPRETMRDKAEALVKKASEDALSNPQVAGGRGTAADILDWKQLQQIREDARRVGELDAVDEAIRKVLPQFDNSVPEAATGKLADLADKAREAASPAGGLLPDSTSKAALDAERELVNRSRSAPLSEFLKQTGAINRTSTPGMFADKTTSLTSQAEDAVADAMRSTLRTKAPTAASALDDRAIAEQIIRSVKDFNQAKTAKLGPWNAIQRIIYSPAVATRLANTARVLGVPAEKASQNSELVKLLRQVILRSSSLSQ